MVIFVVMKLTVAEETPLTFCTALSIFEAQLAQHRPAKRNDLVTTIPSSQNVLYSMRRAQKFKRKQFLSKRSTSIAKGQKPRFLGAKRPATRKEHIHKLIFAT
jgi:hypothetical protein